MKQKKHKFFVFLQLNKLFKLDYSDQFSAVHNTMQTHVSYCTILNHIIVISDNEFNSELFDRYLAIFNLSRSNYEHKSEQDIYVLPILEFQFYNEMIIKAKNSIHDKPRLQIKILSQGNFDSIVPPALFKDGAIVLKPSSLLKE